ncbi:hypothetical protein A2U01_0079871, partial [Trifolium medium]|nr:hypothetical protein [Trifolium medium]
MVEQDKQCLKVEVKQGQGQSHVKVGFELVNLKHYLYWNEIYLHQLQHSFSLPQ